jgi:hypothetical protein
MNDPAEFDVDAVIGKLLAQETGEVPDGAFEREKGLYLAAPEAKRRIVDQRLAAFDLLPPKEKRTPKDIVDVGKRLGIARNNVYRMLKRMHVHGPVSTLLPGHHLKPREGAANKGFGNDVNGWIDDALHSKADISLAEIARFISTKAKLLALTDSSRSIELPSAASLRRRVLMLRGQGKTSAHADTLGESVFIDHCPTEMFIRPRGGEVPDQRVFLTAVLDATSNVVLSTGAFVSSDPATGISVAFRHIGTRAAWFAGKGFGFVDRPSQVRWTVPDGLVPFANEVQIRAASTMPRTHLVTEIDEEGRMGTELYRRLGGRLGPIRLMARNPGEDDGNDAEGGFVLTLRDANAAFRFAVVERDVELLKSTGVEERRLSRKDDQTTLSFVAAMEELFRFDQ